MRTFGLIGFPLTHSFSPTYFSRKFENESISDARYLAFPLENINELDDLINTHQLSGLNVTIPYKQSVIPLLDTLSEEAEKIGAVNTIKISNGKKMGYNTDVFGFSASLISFLEGETSGVKALILGDGGASKAVQFALKKMKIEYIVVSRKSFNLPYKQLDKSIMKENVLIINTTPVGMYPEIEKCPPIPYDLLSEKHFLFDLIYNPEKTLFLTNGLNRGCKINNGYKMLISQAEKSWEIWNNH